MKTIDKLNSGDLIIIDLFGKEAEIEVFSTGDNQFDENGILKMMDLPCNAILQ